MSANFVAGVIPELSARADGGTVVAPEAGARPDAAPVSREHHDIAVATAISLASFVAVVVGGLVALVMIAGATVEPETQANEPADAVVAATGE